MEWISTKNIMNDICRVDNNNNNINNMIIRVFISFDKTHIKSYMGVKILKY